MPDQFAIVVVISCITFGFVNVSVLFSSVTSVSKNAFLYFFSLQIASFLHKIIKRALLSFLKAELYSSYYYLNIRDAKKSCQKKTKFGMSMIFTTMRFDHSFILDCSNSKSDFNSFRCNSKIEQNTQQ